MLYNLDFFSSKCLLFHNAALFGFCITHILNTGCAKIWNKIRRQKVNHLALKTYGEVNVEGKCFRHLCYKDVNGQFHARTALLPRE